MVTAAPGAGKTTRVPPALLGDGPVILLQPRRVAARTIAARIAAERGWTLGREVGWQVRFERRFTSGTRLLAVTEGVLTARLQRDPLASEFRTIVLDEFHERSVHADVAIALAREAWRAREDLRIVVMSATLDAGAVSAFLGLCPVIDVPGRTHPIDIAYAPGQSVADAAIEALGAGGDVLCFLPGAAEIRRAIADIAPRAADVEVLPLHGSLDADEQERALGPSARRRIIVATNLAETSVTVPGVTAVVDSGLQKVPPMPRINAPAAPAAWRQDAYAGCGTRAIGCAHIASPTSTGSISPARRWTLSRGAAIRGPSSGSRRRRRARPTRRSRCSHGLA